jgi:glycyl-tRNA synthetase beta chain
MAHEYFFELLVEEIPAWMHAAAEATLRQRLMKFLEEVGCEGDLAQYLKIVTTPRRIAFYLRNLPDAEADRADEIKGPPKKMAYDASGSPTPALLGFLKKNNAAPESVIDSGDEYIRIRRETRGRSTEELLRAAVPPMIESMRWPKMMQWGAGGHEYIRPVHSVISLFDETVLPIRIFGVEASNRTVGHRTLAPASIEVASFNEYVSKLELARVVVDAKRRRVVMELRAQALAAEVRGAPAVDERIWTEWQYLTEYPGLVRAEFREEFLRLPEEVLVTVMRVHQKQLPIRDAKGGLTSSFLAVMDNEGDPDGNAAYGNGFVTNARFADASFFYEVDRKKPLEERLDQLEHLQFHEKLGNYAQKAKRLASMVERLSGDPLAVEAARLSKCDLVTEMVKEFTDLQGQVGGIYAREEGQPEPVWQAIYDHYLPMNAADALPRQYAGAIVSLADKLDTLTGFFSIGAKPTGSKDPFALRRAAQGIVLILLGSADPRLSFDLRDLIDQSLKAWKLTGAGGPNPESRLSDAVVRQELLAFFADRVRSLLEAEPYTLAYDELAAAMEAGWASSLTDLVDRARALHAVRQNPAFLSILDSAKRIANITASHTPRSIDPSLFEHDVERRLHELSALLTEQIDELVAARLYERAFESFAGMAPELEKFFDDVMVNVDDEKVRDNRMSLLRQVGGAVMKIADVTKIVVDRRELSRKA